ncbi:proteasome subunit alpha [Nocardioides jiangsuensis]|uniref:proteasome subunit alpha n=1 Tax=Nocardioides jiangsuensis TaxID=2866161 RepID=UPI001CEC3D0C|nr:proteasome subunit alpha [Nocardioides jiangsuensis]
MSMPFYVSPEQLMKDRADFARKGIARGRSVAVLQYADGIVFVSENPSQALHKVSEIYDRIAFAAVGRYNEFENLRIAGVRLADMRGYAYDRRDVTGRGLANAYAQTLGTIFSSGGEKPYEVEIFVAEVGDTVEDDQIYRLTYDGQVADEHGFAVMGGNTEAVTGHLRENYRPGSSLGEVLQLAVGALGQSDAGSRVIAAADLEVAVLDRTRSQQRKFKRLSAEHLASLLGERVGEEAGRHAAGDSTNPSNTDQSRNRDQEQPPVAPPVAPPVSPQPQQPPQPSDPVTPPEHPDVYPPVDPGDPLR